MEERPRKAAPELFLCLDTSTSTARVAVLGSDGAVLFAVEATAERHSAQVLPLCAAALRRVGASPADLSGIACGGGPGSFTGLRVGLAVAKGLALPTGVPLYLVSSLEALALDILEARGAGVIAVPCLDAGKGEVHVAAYASAGEALADGLARLRPSAAPARLAPAALPEWLAALESRAVAVAGNGATRYADAVGAARVEVVGPTAVSIGRLALGQRARGESSDLAAVVPLYGRAPDITLKRPAGP